MYPIKRISDEIANEDRKRGKNVTFAERNLIRRQGVKIDNSI